MKRNLLTILLAFFVAFGVNAQKAETNLTSANNNVRQKVIGQKSLHKIFKPNSKAVIFSEDFEGGAMPTGWSEQLGAATDGWTFNTDASSEYWEIPAHTTYAAINDDKCNCDMSDVWLITPAVDLSGTATPKILFEALPDATYGGSHMLKVSTDGGASWDDFPITASSAWTAVECDLTAYAGQAGVIFAFYYTDNGYWRTGMGVDDVVVFEPEVDDLGADAVTPSGFVMTGSTVTPQVTIRNHGSSDQAAYSVELTDGGTYTSTVSVATVIIAGAYAIIDMDAWTPADGNYTLTATVTLTGDTNTANDIATSDVEVRDIGFGDVVSTFNTENVHYPGIETDGTNIYVACWLDSYFERYDMNGVFEGYFTIEGVSEVRDMAYNSNTGYFYGAAANTSLFEMDLTNETLISTTTIPTECRAIAYDDVDNTFWANNWSSPLTEFNPDGSVTGRTIEVNSIYGAAYDNWSDSENPTLWVFHSEVGGTIVEYALDGTLTGREIDISTVPGFIGDVGSGMGGGLASYEDKEIGIAYLLANIQQDPNLIVKFYLASTKNSITFHVHDIVPNNIVGATVYINGEELTTDVNGDVVIALPDGDYDYTVIAAGFSNGTGTVTVAGSDLIEDVLLDAGTTEWAVTFTVTDGTNPIEGANVNFNAIDVLTDTDGVAVFYVADATDIPYSVTMLNYDEVTGTQTIAGASVAVPIVMSLTTFVATFTVTESWGANALIDGASIVVTDGTNEFTGTTVVGVATIDLPIFNGYNYTVSGTGYVGETGILDIVDADVSVDVVLDEAMPAVALVTVTTGADNAVIDWQMQVECEFRYDDGVSIGELGTPSGTDNTVLGSSHAFNAEISEVSWYLTSAGGPHTTVNVFVFGLDESGTPDHTNILYSAMGVTNTDLQWNTHTLPSVTDAPNGFFVGVSYAGFLALGGDDGIDEPYVFKPNTQWYAIDYTTGNWVEAGSLQSNFMIRAVGFNNGALKFAKTAQSASVIGDLTYIKNDIPVETELKGAKETAGYDVYFMTEADQATPANWISVATDLASDVFTYTDNVNWPATVGSYYYAVIANYESGDAEPTFSDLLTVVGVNDVNSAISIYPNPSNGVFNVNVNETYNLEIVDITGKTISTQTIESNATVNINNAGVYFLRFSNNKANFVEKVIVK